MGGGISGLAAAHRAVELARERARPLELMLLEARDRLGGTIETERADGFVLEAGPDSFISEKPWALALCGRLGLEGRLVRTDDRYRRTFVWYGGGLHPLPDGFQLLAPTKFGPFVASRLFSWPGKLRMALEMALPRGGGFVPRAPDADESLGSFVRRRLGAEALERVAQPLVAGIYTADPDELSLAATMPRFLELERRERSVVLALWRAGRRAPDTGTSGARWSLFVTLRGGMGELVDSLAARLPAGAVALKQRVTGLERAGAGWREPPAALRRSGCRDLAHRYRLRLVGHHHLGVSPGRCPASPRRLRLRGAAGRAPRAPRLHLLEREVSGPGPGGHGAAALLPRRGPRRANARAE